MLTITKIVAKNMSDAKKRDAESKRKPEKKQSLLSNLIARLKPSARDEKRAKKQKISVEIKRPAPSVLLGQKSPHFALAVKALEYAQSFVVKGSSELANNLRDPEQYAAVKKGVDDFRQAAEQEVTRRWEILRARGFPDSNELYIGFQMQTDIDMVKKLSLANCGELSYFIADFCEQQGFKGPIWIYRIDDGNHEFAVIGEGDDALVCDPWSNKIYPFADLNQHLEDFVSQTRQTRQGRVADYKLRPFDAKTQKLEKIASMENLVRFRAVSEKYYRDLDSVSLQLQTAAKNKDWPKAMQFIEQGAMWTDSIYKDLPHLRKLLAKKLCEAVRENNVELVQQWLFRDSSLANSTDSNGDSLLDLVISNKNTAMMKALLNADVDLSGGRIASELLIRWAQVRLKKSDVREKKESKLADNQIKGYNWFVGCIKKYPSNAAAAYNELMREHIKLGDIDTALQIFSAFPEFNLSANYFVDYYFTSLDSDELSQAFNMLVQRTDISEQAKDAIKMAVFYYALRHDSVMRDLILAVFSRDPYFINTKDKEGNTALHIAAREGNLKVIQFLLGSPNHALEYIDLSVENDVGATPYDVGTPEAQALLQSFMQHESIQQQQPGQLGQSFADIGQVDEGKEEKIRSRRASSPDKPQFEPPPFVRSHADSKDSLLPKDKKEKGHPIEQKREVSVSQPPTLPPPLEGSRASGHNESHSEPPSPRSLASSVSSFFSDDKEDHPQEWGDNDFVAPPSSSPPPSPHASPRSSADMSGGFWSSMNKSPGDKKEEKRLEIQEKEKVENNLEQDNQPITTPETDGHK